MRSTWSSGASTASRASSPKAAGFPKLSAHEAYLSLGLEESERKAAYRALVEVELPEADIEAIRKATRGGYRVGEQRPARGRKARDQGEAGNQSTLLLV